MKLSKEHQKALGKLSWRLGIVIDDVIAWDGDVQERYMMELDEALDNLRFVAPPREEG